MDGGGGTPRPVLLTDAKKSGPQGPLWNLSSSLHSERSLAWDHVRGGIDDLCGSIANFCGDIADLCVSRSLRRSSAARSPIVAWLAKHHKTLLNIEKHHETRKTLRYIVKHREPLVKHHETLLKHCETWNTQTLSFDATISALDVETSALDAKTSALDAETSAIDAETLAIARSYRWYRRGVIGEEFSAILAIAVLV